MWKEKKTNSNFEVPITAYRKLYTDFNQGRSSVQTAQADIMLHIQIHSITGISKMQILACTAFIGKVELCVSCFFMLVQKYDWSKVSLEHEDV